MHSGTYYVDGHSDVHVSIGDGETFNVDTGMYGDVSIASSEANPTGYYGTYATGITGESTVAVASSMSNPAGMYGTGGASPEELEGKEEPPYTGKGEPYNLNTPPDKLTEGDWV